jgi:hypothetical protein
MIRSPTELEPPLLSLRGAAFLILFVRRNAHASSRLPQRIKMNVQSAELAAFADVLLVKRAFPRPTSGCVSLLIGGRKRAMFLSQAVYVLRPLHLSLFTSLP